MSCYIMDEKTVIQIADFLHYMLERDNIPKELYAALRNCTDECHSFSSRRIYEHLSHMNRVAYVTRYPHSKLDVNDFAPYRSCPAIYNPFHWQKKTSCTDGHWLIESWMYAILRSVEDFLYQCDEKLPDEMKLLYDALVSFKEEWMRFIVHNSEGYNTLTKTAGE